MEIADSHDTPPLGWWLEAFPDTPGPAAARGHPAGPKTMYVVVAYDITNPKRLRKAALCCEEYGLRVQYSIFECRLDPDRFEDLWTRLQAIIDPLEDKLVAYPIHGASAGEIRTHGRMLCHEKVVAYVF